MLAVSGIAAGTASAAGGGHQTTGIQAVAATLAYRCRFPSGPHRVIVAVAAHVPATARAGRPIQPTSVQLTATLPPAAVADFASRHFATVGAGTLLTVSAMEGATGTSIVWPGTTRRSTPVPARGGLTLTALGPVPSVTPAGRGEVVLTAAGLAITLTPGRADTPVPGTSPTPVSGEPSQGSTPTPAPASGSALRVPCALAAGQQATLATEPVMGAVARASGHSAAPHAPKCPALPPAGLKLNPRFKPPPLPPNTPPHSSPSHGCAYAVGYADARKLKGAALIQPGLTNVDLFVRVANNNNNKIDYIQFDNAAELDFHGRREFPPSTATFLTFGFVPTTATIQLVEHGTIDIFIVGPAGVQSPCKPNRFRTCDNIATVASQLSVVIVPGSVMVNGVPLDVGSHCETPPFDAVLTGTSASNPPYNVLAGGPVDGMVNIPPFHNCGVGENLDPIFNAAISGPRNFNLLTQGAVCFVQGGGVCDPRTGLPEIPTPIRKVTG